MNLAVLHQIHEMYIFGFSWTVNVVKRIKEKTIVKILNGVDSTFPLCWCIMMETKLKLVNATDLHCKQIQKNIFCIVCWYFLVHVTLHHSFTGKKSQSPEKKKKKKKKNRSRQTQQNTNFFPGHVLSFVFIISCYSAR